MSYLLTILSVLLLSSCASVKTDFNFNQSIDFSQYKTYSWIKPGSKSKENKFNDLMHSEVIRSIETALESKGLKKTNYNKADIHINYMINVSNKVMQSQYYDYYTIGGATARMGRGYGPYGYYGSGGPYYSTRMEYEQASFVIDMLDKNTRGIAWRGHASKTIDRGNNMKKQLEIIKSTIEKLFKKYPPKK